MTGVAGFILHKTYLNQDFNKSYNSCRIIFDMIRVTKAQNKKMLTLVFIMTNLIMTHMVENNDLVEYEYHIYKYIGLSYTYMNIIYISKELNMTL